MLTLLIAAPPPTGRWGAIQLRQSAHSREHFRRGNAWSDLAILRTTPALLGLFSLVTLWAGELMQAPATAARPRGAAWYDKKEPTFSDAIAASAGPFGARRIFRNCPGGRTGPTTGGRLTLQRNSSVAAGSMRIADQL